jgi:hypothetical protein
VTEDTPEAPEPNVLIDPQQMAGVWANWARVSHSPYEFTLDFVRLDFTSLPPGGVVVARVSVSPLLISQLIDTLRTNWELYAQKAMPSEVYQTHERSDPEGDGGQPDPPPQV